MPRVCTVCQHPERSAIDRALLGDESYREVAKRFEASEAAMWRHKSAHLQAALIASSKIAVASHGDSLLAELERLADDARRIAAKAESAGSYQAALAGVRELIRIVELLAKLRGELDAPAASINIVLLPEWEQLRGRILAALTPFPDARAAVAQALAVGRIESTHV
jgi:hypothetical protein